MKELTAAQMDRACGVAIACAMLRGVPLEEALPKVCGVLPTVRPNPGFRAALKRLEQRGITV